MFGFARRKDVLVVGAGPTGLFTALRLAANRVRVRIIDEQRNPTPHAYGAALHPDSLETLDELGLADPLIAAGSRISRMALYDGQRRRAVASFDTSAGTTKQKFPFVLALPQAALEEALKRALADRGVEVEQCSKLVRLGTDYPAPADPRMAVGIERWAKESIGYAVAGSSWAIEDIEEARTSWLIGADGANSAVRRLTGIGFENTSEPAHYAVFEFKSATGNVSRDEVREVIDEFGLTSVLWPLPGNRWRWTFELEGPAEPGLDIGALAALVAQRAPWFVDVLNGASDMRLAEQMSFSRRLADCFAQNQTWLVGDAAHVSGPVGLKSMNVGLNEAVDVAKKLTAIIRAKADPAEQMAQYNEARRQEWRRLLGIDAWLTSDANADPWVRGHAASIHASLPASGAGLAGLGRQLGLGFSV